MSEPLARYFSILDGGALPMFMLSRCVPVEWDPSSPLSSLWRAHEAATSQLHELLRREEKVEPTSPNLLELKTEIAKRMLKSCAFCERRCGVDRRTELGWCRVGEDSYVSSEFLHMGEEWELVPSHTIFFCGCTFECVYCQNWQISQHPTAGDVKTPESLASAVERRFAQGAKNVNFVTPTPHVHTVLDTLLHLDMPVPVVWNSNMYHTQEVAELLDGVVDVYLGDLKYGSDACAYRLSGAKGYWEVATRNFLHAERCGEVLLRHLVLPSHIECCTRPIIEWAAEHLRGALFNLMFQYHPDYRAHEYPELARGLTSQEMDEALRMAQSRLEHVHG